MNLSKNAYFIPLALGAWAVIHLSAQVTPVPGVAPPTVGTHATVAATEAAIQRSRQDPAAVARGDKLFLENCGYCHGATAKGTDIGPDLMRSKIVLDDEKGELVFPKVRNHSDKKAISASLTDAQLSDIDAWLKVQYYGIANRATYSYLNIAPGDPKKGEAFFNGAGKCNTCHSVTGDLAGIGGKYEPHELQSLWISGGGRGGRGGRAGRGGRGGGGGGDAGSTVLDETPPAIGKGTQTVTVTLADGKTINGVVLEDNDFNLAIKDMQGKYHSWTKVGGFPKVVVHNPLAAHGEILRSLTDDEMHNMTAYLGTLK